jgi:hypothetical protein
MVKKLNLEDITKKITPFLRKKRIKKAGVFGSHATGKSKKSSDVDILIEFSGSLLDLVRLEIELQKILNRKVDLLTYKGINPLLKKRILEEEIRII